MAGGFFTALLSFGGLRSQLNLLSVARNLCVTESVNLGLSYPCILSPRLYESARMRIIAPDEFA